MRLAIDAMSGDLGSSIVVKAVEMFAEKYPEVELSVFGKIEELDALKNIKQVTIIDARDTIGMTDGLLAIRRKKESSLVKAVSMVKANEADGLVSCCNTGVYYTCCMLFLKRIEGLEKSCLMASIPTMTDQRSLLLDCGANKENSAQELYQFAILGSVYASVVEHRNNPRVGLLNNGAEEHKGTEVRVETYKLLKNSNLNFIGNIEGTDLLSAEADVIVTDGFTGNVALKTMEGTGKMAKAMLKEIIYSSTLMKLGAALNKDTLKKVSSKLDSKKVGGAPMMGFDHPVIKAHGNSDETAFLNAMILTKTMVENDVVNKMKEGLKDALKGEEDETN